MPHKLGKYTGHVDPVWCFERNFGMLMNKGQMVLEDIEL